MKTLPSARLGFRGPLDTPAAVRAALTTLTPTELALSLLAQWQAAQQPAVRKALASADTHGDPSGSAWVTAQLKRRRAYYAERVLPLLEAAGAPVKYRAAAQAWAKWQADGELVTIV